MAKEYRLISSDGHLEVRPERWTHRVPDKYRDRAPRSVQLPDGSDGVLIEGQPLQEANFLDLRAGGVISPTTRCISQLFAPTTIGWQRSTVR